MAFNIPSPSIGQVFQTQYPFYVPKYQRGYAWEIDELDDFIRDIKSLLNRTSPEIEHFMGGLVHVHIPAANVVSRKHEIVDGQQRMATFTLLMSGILEGLSSIGNTTTQADTSGVCDARIEEIREAFLVYKETQGANRVETAKLVLSKTDGTFFRDLINGARPIPTRDSHGKLQIAFDKLHSELVEPTLHNTALSEVQKVESLVNIYRTVAESCIVIHIVSQNRQEAYRLFSVLNDRGRSLSDGDLLRAKTLELLEPNPAIQARVENHWDSILDGPANHIDKFFKAFFPSNTGHRAPNKDLFGAYVAEFLHAPTPDTIESFVTSLALDKPIFTSISKGEWPFPEIQNSPAKAWDRDRLFRLVHLLSHEAAHPLLLSAVKLGERKFIEVVRFIELFVFRFITVVGAHPSPLYLPYNTEAKSMRADPQHYSISSLKSKLIVLMDTRAGDELFRSNLIAKLQYSDNTVKNREIKHFISTLESYRTWYQRGNFQLTKAPDTMNVIEVPASTIEHIYSKNTPQALQIELIEPLKNRLGNLTIMSGADNSILGNVNFENKKIEYRRSNIGLTSQLSNLDAWDQESIQERENELIIMALRIFKP